MRSHRTPTSASPSPISSKARAILREERGAREPQVGVSAASQYGRLPGVAVPGQKRTDVQVDLGLDVAYEVDLFGRVSRSIEAARGDVGAASADADAVRVAIVSETAGAYADAVSSAERIAVAQHIVDLLGQSLALTERRHQVGLATASTPPASPPFATSGRRRFRLSRQSAKPRCSGSRR